MGLTINVCFLKNKGGFLNTVYCITFFIIVLTTFCLNSDWFCKGRWRVKSDQNWLITQLKDRKSAIIAWCKRTRNASIKHATP